MLHHRRLTPLFLFASIVADLRCQQPPIDEHVARLREVVNRETLTEAAAAARARDAAAWLEATKELDLGDRAVLRLVAGTQVADAQAKRRASRELVE
jgi:hypothetical protein